MIELYHAEDCPYCVRVRKFFEDAGVVYVSKALPLRKDSPIKAELLKVGGKIQVPFLVDPEKGTKLYESLDIIDYVKKNYLSATA